MARSRYAKTPIVDGRAYGTFQFPVRSQGLKEIDLLEGSRFLRYTVRPLDRADTLAARFLGDDGYWWVICLVNGISYPWGPAGLYPGREIRIPLNVKDVLDVLG